MSINCNYVKCGDCDKYEMCNLHEPATFDLFLVRKELNWKVNRLNEINKGINHFTTWLHLFNREESSDFEKKYLSKQTIQQELNWLHLEKKQIQSEIRELQIKESNINKILKRRYGI